MVLDPSDDARDTARRLAGENDALRRRVEMLAGVAEEAAYRAHFAALDAAGQEQRALAAEARLAQLRNMLPVRLARGAAQQISRRLRGLRTTTPPSPLAERSSDQRAHPANGPTATVPIVIIVRDRLEPLQQLVNWLERAGLHDVVLVDNASTYPPLVAWLDECSYRVVRLPHNLGHRAPWIAGVIAEVGYDRHFVVTDPDVVPDDACPLDALDHFRTLLDAHPDIDKVGFGLRIDDLPAHYALADEVRRWEARYWTDEIAPGVYRAAIDTTFALYRPGRWHRLDAALRTGPPYVARHIPWYANTASPTDEERYYHDHLDPSVNTWDQGRSPSWRHEHAQEHNT
jgi:hypothetical protein